MPDNIITIAEAARRLGVSRQRVEQMLDSGTLPTAPRIARGVRADDVDRLIEQRAIGQRPVRSTYSR